MPTSTANGENSRCTGAKPSAASRLLTSLAERGLRSEDDHPGIHAHQKIASERQHHQQHHQVAALLRAARDEQRQRIGHEQTDQRGGKRDQKGLEKDIAVDDVAEEELVCLQRQPLQRVRIACHERRQPAEFARVAERGEHHDDAGGDKEQQQIDKRRTAHQPPAKACLTRRFALVTHAGTSRHRGANPAGPDRPLRTVPRVPAPSSATALRASHRSRARPCTR